MKNCDILEVRKNEEKMKNVCITNFLLATGHVLSDVCYVYRGL